MRLSPTRLASPPKAPSRDLACESLLLYAGNFCANPLVHDSAQGVACDTPSTYPSNTETSPRKDNGSDREHGEQLIEAAEIVAVERDQAQLIRQGGGRDRQVRETAPRPRP